MNGSVTFDGTIRISDGSVVRALAFGKSHGAPRIVMLHGNPGSLANWSKLAPLLAESYHVMCLDLPGFGESTRSNAQSPEDVSLARLANAVVETLNAFNWQSVVVVGHSHGGGVAQVIAASYPERVRAIVLLGTLGFPAHLTYHLLSLPGARRVLGCVRPLMERSDWVGLRVWLVKRFMGRIFAPETPSNERALVELGELAARSDILLSMADVASGKPCATLKSTAGQIRCPTLFIHGDRDQLVPTRNAQNVHQVITSSGGSSRFARLPGAGHLLLEYQAAECSRLVGAFVGELSAVH